MIFDMRGAVSWRQKNTYILFVQNILTGERVYISEPEQLPAEFQSNVIGGEWYKQSLPIGMVYVHIKKAIMVNMELN